MRETKREVGGETDTETGEKGEGGRVRDGERDGEGERE